MNGVSRMMNKRLFDNITELEQSNTHSIIQFGEKKFHSNKKVLFKTFKFYCSNAKKQKRFGEVFYKISSVKHQTLINFRKFSFSDFSSKPRPILASKYISQLTLEALFCSPKVKKQWNINLALNGIFAIATGLFHIHKNGICHGNLCLSNIIIDEIKQVYICDYGLFPLKEMYIPHSELFNRDYSAPELTEQTAQPTNMSDIYSFGLLTCKMLSYFFFPKSDKKDWVNAYIQSLKNGDEFDLSFLPLLFQEIVTQCTEKDPLKRPPTKSIIEKFQDSTYSFSFSETNLVFPDIYKSYQSSNYIMKLAESGNLDALNKLGDMYSNGPSNKESNDDNNNEKNNESNNDSYNIPQDFVKGTECYSMAALKGHSEAQSNYGVCLQEGIGTKKNLSLGAHFLMLSAKQGNLNGLANYGVALLKGDGVHVNKTLAEKYLKEAADIGYAYAQINYGLFLLESPKRQIEGAEYIKKAAMQGDPDGICTYGVCLALGEGTEMDLIEAAKYFKLAAEEHNYPRAKYEYAKCFMDGRGVEMDLKKALEYFESSYEDGYEDAEIEIKKLKKIIGNETERTPSLNGKKRTRVKKNSKEKSETTTKNNINNTNNETNIKINVDDDTKNEACIKNNADDDTKSTVDISELNNDREANKENSNSIFNEITQDEFNNIIAKHHLDNLSPNEKEIVIKFFMLKKKLKNNASMELYSLEDEFVKSNIPEIIYQFGKIFDKLSNEVKSIKYYKQAAEMGHPGAMAAYGVCLQEGQEGVEKNPELGFTYLLKSANAGNLNGLSNAGVALINGDGVKKNFDKGMKYLKKAAIKGNTFAQLNFGIHSQNSKRSKSKYYDLKVGAEFIKKAADKGSDDAILAYAKCLRDGEGVDKNMKEAMDIFDNAIESNKITDTAEKSELLNDLYYFYQENDPIKSMKYCKILAEELNINFFEYIYGMCLLKGAYVDQNEEQGKILIEKSGMSPKLSKDVRKEITKLQREKIEENPNQNDSKVFEYALYGDIPSTVKVAKFLIGGKNEITQHISLNKRKAINFLLKYAADKFDNEACYLYGKMLCETKEYEKGILYLNKAAENGIVEAKIEALYYSLFYKKDKNAEKAININEAKMIASQKNIHAMILVIKKSFKTNIEEAKHYLKLIVEFNTEDIEITGLNRICKYYFNIFFDDANIFYSNNAGPKATLLYYITQYIENTDGDQKIKKLIEFLTLLKSNLKNNSNDYQAELNLTLPQQTGKLNAEQQQQQKLPDQQQQKLPDQQQQKLPDQQQQKLPDQQQQKLPNQQQQKLSDQQQQKLPELQQQKLPDQQQQQKLPNQQQQKLPDQQQQLPEQQAEQRYNVHQSPQQANETQNTTSIEVETPENHSEGNKENVENSLDSDMIKKSPTLVPNPSKSHIQQISSKRSDEFDDQAEVKNNLLGLGKIYYNGNEHTQKNLEIAFKYFLRSCEFGSDEAEVMLGKMYMEGEGVQQNLNEGAKHFMIAAQRGHPEGQNLYGDCLRLAKGVRQDIPKALHFYKLSADQNYTNAQFNFGMANFFDPALSDEIKDKNLGFEYIQKAAYNKHSEAMFLYSQIIKDEYKTESDKFLKLSANAGFESAILVYGNQLKEDENTQKEAANLFKKAADNGMVTGFIEYGKCLSEGIGVKPNPELAKKLLKTAADSGNKEGIYAYANFLWHFDEPEKEVIRYFKLAVDAGHVKAYFQYGQFLEEGFGVPVDKRKALYYYRKSLECDPDSLAKYKDLNRLEKNLD